MLTNHLYEKHRPTCRANLLGNHADEGPRANSDHPLALPSKNNRRGASLEAEPRRRRNVIPLTDTPISARLALPPNRPSIDPDVNRAGERTSIPGLEHTVLTEGESTGRRQRPPSDDGHDAMAEHLQGAEPLNLDARRMHIQVTARRFARELVRTHKGKTDRMSDHPAPQETPSRGAQGMLGRTASSESQLDRARVSAMTQGPQDRCLVFFAREPANHEDANDRRLPHLVPTTTHLLAERHAVRQEQQGRSHTQLRHSFRHGVRGTLNEVTAIEYRALPQLEYYPIQKGASIEIHGRRQVFRMRYYRSPELAHHERAHAEQRQPAA